VTDVITRPLSAGKLRRNASRSRVWEDSDFQICAICRLGQVKQCCGLGLDDAPYGDWGAPMLTEGTWL
jgi:hypothetical protein